MDWSDDLGLAVQRAREKRRWSRPDLAKESGLSVTTIESLEKNLRRDDKPVNPERRTVDAVVAALDDPDVYALLGTSRTDYHRIVYQGDELEPDELEYILTQVDFIRTHRRR